jgi:hypothetical protein
MNPDPENIALPLDELTIAPQWLKAPAKTFEHYSGEDRERRGGDRRDVRRSGPRERGPRPEGRRDSGGPSPRRDDAGKGPRGPQGPGRGPRPADRFRSSPNQPRPELRPPPVAMLAVEFLPEEKGFASMLGTMKASVKAYQLFDLAKLVLNKPERHLVRLTRLPAKEGEKPGLFYVVAGNDTPLLSQADAVRFVMRNLADKVYTVAKKPIEPPRGNFQFVCKCGLTGEILGPSTYHEYQSRLVRHHQRRLGHVPFAQFKSCIETVRDPVAVQAWIESMSFVTEYQCAQCPAPTAFNNRDEIEKHFVEQHLASLITTVPAVTIAGVASRQLASEAILNCIRQEWESELRFPLKTANVIRPRLSQEGFHLFKRHKGVSYVTRIRPKRFETLEQVSPHLRRIIMFLRDGDGHTGPELVTFLAQPLVPDVDGAAPVPMPILDPDSLTRDVHWLVSEGYVVEFADGRFWAPKEKPPEPPPKAAGAAPVAATTPATEPVIEALASTAETLPTAPEASQIPAVILPEPSPLD